MRHNILLNSLDKYNTGIDSILKKVRTKVKSGNNFKFIIPVIDLINSNKLALLLFLFMFMYIFSDYIIYLINLYLLLDSVIISLIILQNNALHINSRRLAKNIILKTLLYFNFIGSTLTFLFVVFIYNEHNKFINRIIFKFIKLIIYMITKIIPYSNILYADAKLLNFDEHDKTMDSDEYYSTLKSKKYNSNKTNKNNKNNKTIDNSNSISKSSKYLKSIGSKMTDIIHSSELPDFSLDEYASNTIIKSKEVKSILKSKNKKKNKKKYNSDKSILEKFGFINN
jgi:hypothetical protein